MTLADNHRAYLNQHAVTDDTIEKHLIRSEGDEIIFPWRDGDLVTEQRRPWPGDSGVYYWEKGKDLHFWDLVNAGPSSPVLLIEGTKQSLAAASYAPAGYSVLGMAGCEGWNKCDLSRFENRDVFIGLDADAGSNLSVYEAGALFAAEAEFYQARVQYLWLPARGSAGMDDVLAKHPADRRARFISYLVGKAEKRPAEKKPTTRKGARMETELPDVGDRVGVAVNLDRKEVIDKITDAIKDKLDGTELFNYGDVITRVVGHETVPLDRDSFHAQLADAVATFHYSPATDKRPAIFEPKWPDPPTVGAVMSKAREFSPLRRVVRVPFLRPDGTICSEPGYDAATQTVLALGDLEVETVDESPSHEDVLAAAKFLMEDWLGDFPFETPADRANALGLLLTPFIRGLVPLVPLAVINGLEAGVGKNLIADCYCILATGEAAMPLPWVNNEEEMRKQITSSFAGGAELFVFDEAHQLEGAQMARALTSLTYGDRILGVSRIAKFPNQATWMSLGNQVQVNGDMSRRVYFVALKPYGTTLNDRDSREYRHPDIKRWTTENRPALVRAALTVLRGWHAAGAPSWSRGASMGSFEPWDRLLSSVTAYAGYPHFLTDVKERRSESDFQGAYWEAHIHWAYGVFGSREFTTREVQAAALKDPGGYESPPEMEDASGKSYTRQLGKAYAKHVNRQYNGLTLIKAGIGHRSTLKWAIHPTNGGVEGTGGSSPAPALMGDSVEAARVSRTGGGGEKPPNPPVPSEAELEATAEAQATDPDSWGGDREPVILGFDIETASASYLWTGGHEGPFVKLVGGVGTGVRADGGHAVGTNIPGLIDALNSADVLYGHRIFEFDLLALARHCGADYDALAAKAVCTLTHTRLLDPPVAKGTPSGYYSLDSVAKRLGHTGKSDDLKALSIEYGKAAGFTGKAAEVEGYALISPSDPRYVDYLHGDLDATEFVFKALPELDDYARREMRVAAFQNRMVLNGWKVNRELLAERVAREDQQRTEAMTSLAELGMPTEKVEVKLKPKADWPVDYRSMPVAEARVMRDETPELAVSEGIAVEKRTPYAAPWATKEGKLSLMRALQDAGAEHVPMTPGGELAMSSDALGRVPWYDGAAGRSKPGLLQVYGHIPEVCRIAELIGRATGATAKYAEIAKYVTAEGRVHPEIGDVQASGRWATLHPASSNLGKRGEKVEQREPFVPDDGHVHLTVDLSQVDMRAMAGLSGDTEYMKLFAPGRNAHREMSVVYFGEATKENYGSTKALNHAMNYGQGPKAASERTGLSLEKCYEVAAAKAAAYPRLAEYIQEVRDLGAAGHLLDNGFGRKLRCTPERAYTQAPALVGQSASRDIMCESILRLIDARPDVTPYLRGVVHDELIISVPREDAAEWQEELRRAMTWEWKGVPILCEVSEPAENWARCYDGE